MNNYFSGSYDPQDVRFLLKPVHMDFVDVVEKERRIQSGQRHYSEMLSAERLPSARYMELFAQAMQRNASRFAQDIWRLAGMIARNADRQASGAITLASLARAGTPIGVLLKRSLDLLGRESRHYSLSIIRDRGIDTVALRFMLEQEGRPPNGVVFVDGWTGKGVIGAELKKSVADFNRQTGLALPDTLHVVADLCGLAAVSATSEDYLLPSSLLNAIISGLVSRSVLNAQVVGPGDFHACVYHAHWRKDDLSRWFVDTIFAEIQALAACATPSSTLLGSPDLDDAPDPEKQRRLQQRSAAFLRRCGQEFGVTDLNHIKPGIGEATRVLLRRVPRLVLLRDSDHVDTRHLIVLAEEKSVPVRFDPELPYAAVTLISTMSGN